MQETIGSSVHLSLVRFKKFGNMSPIIIGGLQIIILFSKPYLRFNAQKKYYYLRIHRNSGGYWNYIAPEFVSLDLITALRAIEKRSENITLILPH